MRNAILVFQERHIDGFCLYGCFSKPQAVVLDGGAAGLPEDFARVSGEVRQRRRLSPVFGGLSLARWLRVSSVRIPQSLRISETETLAVLHVGIRFR